MLETVKGVHREGAVSTGRLPSKVLVVLCLYQWHVSDANMLRACSLFIHSIHTNHAPCRRKVLLALMQNEVARGHLQLRAPLLAPTSTARNSAIVGEEQGGRGSGAPRVLMCTAAAARVGAAGRRGGEGQGGLGWGWNGLGCRLWWLGQA